MKPLCTVPFCVITDAAVLLLTFIDSILIFDINIKVMFTKIDVASIIVIKFRGGNLTWQLINFM